MARIRTVKPDFWTDPDAADLSFAARLAFIGMWNFADDYGVIRDDARRLKLQILPSDDVDMAALIDELVDVGKVERGVTPDGEPVLHICSFRKHQKIDKRSAPQFCEPEDIQTVPTNPAESRRVPPSPAQSPPSKGRERKGREELLAPPNDDADKPPKTNGRKPDPVFEAVIEACGLDISSLTKTERGRANKAAKELREVGASPDGIKARARVYVQRWPDVELTPTALAGNYGQLSKAKPTTPGITDGVNRPKVVP